MGLYIFVERSATVKLMGLCIFVILLDLRCASSLC